MKSTIGVYDTHDDAIAAIRELKNSGFPTKNVSLIGKADAVDDEVVLKNKNIMNVATTEVGVGAVLGSTLGLLTGVGIFAIPGLGFLFGAGALVGAIAGFDLGLIGGGAVSALTIAGINATDTEGYEEEFRQGKFLLIVHGSEEELNRAKDILQSHGKHSSLRIH